MLNAADVISLMDIAVPNPLLFLCLTYPYGRQGSCSHLLAPPIASLIHGAVKKKSHTVIFCWTGFSFDDGTVAAFR